MTASPFTGRHDLATSHSLDIGPAVLRERVAALNGMLVIESTRQGALLDIGIPFGAAPAPTVSSSSTER